MINGNLLRPATVRDYYVAQENHPSTFLRSYNVLRSSQGFSYSEIEAVLGESGGGCHEFCVEDGCHNLAGFLRVQYVDKGNRSAKIQGLCFVPDRVGTALKILMRYLYIHENVDRFYSFLFPDESCEAAALCSCGFESEARLKEYIYTAGAYRDLLILGTRRGAPCD
jgi:RimJ/RimL family protein N-acetyltransferase